jgi:hypothetical protein
MASPPSPRRPLRNGSRGKCLTGKR